MSRLVITETDAGHNTFTFSEIAGAGAAAASLVFSVAPRTVLNAVAPPDRVAFG